MSITIIIAQRSVKIIAPQREAGNEENWQLYQDLRPLINEFETKIKDRLRQIKLTQWDAQILVGELETPDDQKKWT
jgi:hypothetical protein